jgi:hypothetical protein
VEARVTRDVRVGNRVVIPAGSRDWRRLPGRAGRQVQEHARLAIRQTIVLADGTRPISTDAVIREGAAPATGAKKSGGGS